MNAPIPVGAEYGHHPGGWGRAPIDIDGSPLYPEALRDPREFYSAIKQQYNFQVSIIFFGFSFFQAWGAIIEDRQESSVEEDSDAEEPQNDFTAPPAVPAPPPIPALPEAPMETETPDLDSTSLESKIVFYFSFCF